VEGLSRAVIVNKANRFRILKTDAAGRPLENAKFKLEGPDGSTEILVSDEDGYTDYATCLAPGIWTFYETQAPRGYRKDPAVFHFTVGEDGYITGLTLGDRGETVVTACFEPRVVNYNLQKVRIIKTDIENDEDLIPVDFPEGASFKVEEKIGTSWRDTGMVILWDGAFFVDAATEEEPLFPYDPDTSAGVYRITEISPPEGYILDGTPQEIHIPAVKTADVMAVTFSDRPNRLIIKKTGLDGVTTLSGVRFNFWNTAGRTKVYTTDDSGLIEALLFPGNRDAGGLSSGHRSAVGAGGKGRPSQMASGQLDSPCGGSDRTG